MCLILVAWRTHTEYPCVVAANRDEFYARATAVAQWWPGQPELLAGRDLQAGGTWLAARRNGSWAALTNYRSPGNNRTEAPSRGELVSTLMQAGWDVVRALAYLTEHGAKYNGFNLLYSDGERLGIYESAGARAAVLEPGVYGLSNHLLDTPWPKVKRAKSRMYAALSGLPETRPMLELLRDDTVGAENELPRTGIDPAWERLLSSAFIRAPGYGTRCSTLLLQRADGDTAFHEWSWNSRGEADGSVSFSFQRDAAR
jgi:uncharacterized protein with NRDE domain